MWLKRIACLPLLVGQLLAGQAVNAEVWHHALTESGIELSLRKQEGYDLERVRASMQVNGEVNEVFSWFENAPNYPPWLDSCSRAKWLAKTNKRETIAYLRFDSPWPVQDRDVVFKRVVSVLANGGKQLSYHAIDNVSPEQSCCVRIKKAEGHFRVEPTEQAGRVRVSYEFVSDPAGDLPAWLAAYTLTESPLQSLLNLKQLVERQPGL